MEWTKETLIKTYVICANISQEKVARNFYKSFNFELDMLEMVNLKNHFPCIIGILNYNPNRCVKTLMVATVRRDKRWTEIKLSSKPRRKFPREMLVSDDKKKWEKRLVAGKIKSTSPYVSYIKEEFKEGQVFKFLLAWKYAKEIE